jgi:hypothetical protein
MKNKYLSTRLIADDFDASCEWRNSDRNRKLTAGKSKEGKTYRIIYDTQDFKCRQCGFFVTASRELSGVNNRNHCPRCLWSRHMDLNAPGDRRSECLSRMQPIGLTIKQTNKRYGDNQGELMLVHHCTGCGKISINRVAGDDDTPMLYRLYGESILLCQEMREELAQGGIRLAGASEEVLVMIQLFGKENDPIMEVQRPMDFL